VRVYKATLLFDPATQSPFFGSSLNNKGEVLANLNDPDFSGFHPAIRRHNGKLVPLPAPEGSTSSSATALNDRSDVAGVAIAGTQAFAVLWPHGTGEAIRMGEPTPGAYFSPIRLNNRRQALGFAGFNNYLWYAGQFTPLEPGPGARNASVHDLNNLGHVAGLDVSNPMLSRAVLWRDGVVEPLGLLPGMTDSSADGLNDFDHVVGSSFHNRTAAQRAFVWRQGVMTALPLLHDVDGERNAATDINLWGQIVGNEQLADTPGQGIAILWERGRALDLNTQLTPATPLPPNRMLISAYKINEWGQIVASATDGVEPFYEFSYLLTPAYEWR
jgi:uncharacterized membrane protein